MMRYDPNSAHNGKIYIKEGKDTCACPLKRNHQIGVNPQKPTSKSDKKREKKNVQRKKIIQVAPENVTALDMEIPPRD